MLYFRVSSISTKALVREMYAIIADSGRQYKVEKDQEIDVDFREVAVGEQVTFDRVMALSDDGSVTLGKPTLEGASVTAEVLGPKLGEKLVVQKFRRRKNSRRKTGHRQMFTRVKIREISPA